MLQLKELREWIVGGWKDSEEVRRTTWRASMVRGAPSFPTGPNLRSPEPRPAGGVIVPP